MTMESGEASERILCFPARVLQPEESGILTDLSLWKRIAPNLVPQPRSVVETDPLYKQVVVYLIIRNGELILSYRRARQTQESRLSALLSIGLGGHVNVQDEAGLFSSVAKLTLLRQAVDRELREEVRIDTEVVRGPRLVGFLNDDSDSVGRIDFGTLWLLEISEPRVQPRPGAGVIEVEFQTAADLHRDKPRMENWSRQVLDWLVTSPWPLLSEPAEFCGRGPLEMANRPAELAFVELKCGAMDNSRRLERTRCERISMELRFRHYSDASDYWRVRPFLRELFQLDGRRGDAWHVADFDYWRWHWLENVVERVPDELCLWETKAGELAAVLNQGDPGVCHLHVHPDARAEELESKMIATAEREYAASMDDGARGVWVWASEDDGLRRSVLARHGFAEQPEGGHSTEYHGRRTLDDPVASVPIPAGFVVRSMGDVDELPKRSLASWRSFHPGEAEDGCDKTGSWYRNVQRAPLYRRDLDVVAVAPNGDIASFATCYFDDVSRTGVFVLDGTAHEYQRMGLGKAVMTEALRRLRELGAVAAFVSWYEAPAGALYQSVGFRVEQRGRVWVKWIPG